MSSGAPYPGGLLPSTKACAGWKGDVCPPPRWSLYPWAIQVAVAAVFLSLSQLPSKVCFRQGWFAHR